METTDSYREALKKALIMFANVQANPPAITPDRLDVWEFTLKSSGILEPEIGPTTVRVLQTVRFFPSPSDFVQAARPPIGREDEDLCWSRVLTATETLTAWDSLTPEDLDGDTHLLAALDRFGGWMALNEALCDREALSATRRRVLSEWRYCRENGIRRWFLEGDFDQQNRQRGLSTGGNTRRSALCARWRAFQAERDQQTLPPVGGPSRLLQEATR